MEYKNPAIQPGMVAMLARAAEAAADPTRPVYHFGPPSGWMNDVNGPLLHRGYYHIFYQLNPFHTDARYGTHWGHARSTDLVHWEDLPIAIWPSTEAGETSCYSGTAGFNKDGQPIILYTSTKKWGQGRNALEPFEQWAAVGDDDLINWTKHPDNPSLTLEEDGRPEFDWKWRDPFFFFEQGRSFMVLGATGVGTPIWESESGDLVNWTYRGLASDISQECPNLFKLGDDWVMLTSPYTPVDYYIGDFDIDTYQFHPPRQRTNRADENVLRHQHPLRCRWALPAARSPLAHFPRRGLERLHGPPARPHHRAGRSPTSDPCGGDRDTSRRGHSPPDITLDGQSKVIDVRGDALEIIVEIEPAGATFCGLRVRRSEDGTDGVRIGYDGESVFVGGIDMPYDRAEGQDSLKLRVFLDKSVIEVFVDDGTRVASNFIDCGANDLGIELFARGGAAAFRSIDIWEMESIR